MYQDGQGFVPDEVVEAEVFILGQNPGFDEELEGRPFVGATGQTMIGKYFGSAGLVRGENVSIGNVIRCRWNRQNALPPEAVLKPALRHCMKAHFRPPSQTRLVVAQGALAWRAMGQSTKITEWRGFLAPSPDDALPF